MGEDLSKVLEVRELKKGFGKLQAVDGVSFSIPAGNCYGLLGPNGAGKSTTIEMIERIIKPDSGQILYEGKENHPRYLEELGIQFQQTALLPSLTVRECLDTFRSLYGKSRTTEELISLCQLEKFQENRHENVSGGQRQRLLLAVALCHDPNLIMLDEPTTGLDPQARRHLWEIVKSIKDQGKTILLTTHYMDEAEELCDTIGIMDSGKIVIEGAPRDLLLKHFPSSVVELSEATYFSLQSVLEPLVQKKQIRGNTLELFVENIRPLFDVFSRSSEDLEGVSIRKPNLEDLFIELTGKELRN